MGRVGQGGLAGTCLALALLAGAPAGAETAPAPGTAPPLRVETLDPDDPVATGALRRPSPGWSPDWPLRTRETPAPRAAPEGMFGSTAVRIAASAQSGSWALVLAERGDRYFAPDCAGRDAPCGSPALATIREAVRASAGETVERRAAAVNRAVNGAIRYRTDLDLYGESDHWAPARETLRRRAGDCEDFAILKFWALQAAGVPAEAMRLVLVRDVRRGLDHAVLAVAAEGRNLVLDNLSDRVLADGDAPGYRPLVSLGPSSTWIHGFARPAPRVAEGPQRR